MKKTFTQWKYAWPLLYFALYLPWFFWLEKTVTSDFHIIHTAIDDLIPFSEYFIVPYCVWFFYIGGAIVYFLLTSKEDFYRMCAYLFSGMTVSLLICTVFHNGTDLRPVVDPGKNIFTRMVCLLHGVDTSTNIFPSIHVFNSVAVHVAVTKSKNLSGRRAVRIASLIICVMICLSTVFLKQHSVVDVAGALVMAYLLYPLAYTRSYAANPRRLIRKAMS